MPAFIVFSTYLLKAVFGYSVCQLEEIVSNLDEYTENGIIPTTSEDYELAMNKINSIIEKYF